MNNLPFAIVGLGNLGSQYQHTRHNIGFEVLNFFMEKCQSIANSSWSEKSEHFSLVYKNHLPTKQVCFLIKPQTYMNLSGKAVASFMNFYKIPLSQLLVIHDDVDLDFGAMKLQKSRGSGGHQGINDIHQKLGTGDYIRLKLGVKNEKIKLMQTSSFVLERFSSQEQDHIDNNWGEHINETLLSWMEKGYEKTASLFNLKKGAFA